MPQPDSRPVFPLQSLIDSIEAGAPLPEVDVHDLKRLWQIYESRPPKTVIGHDYVACELSPGANVDAIVLRYVMLYSLFKRGEFAQWQRGSELDDAVFQAAATFAIDRSLNTFPGYAILNQLRNEGPDA